jgi:hypothetical protein
MTITLNGTSGIVNDATNLSYIGTLTGSTGVINIGSGQVYKDASGNVGVGVVPSSWDGVFKALQNKNATLASSGSDLYLFANAYYNSGYKYIATGFSASRFYQDTDGSFNWQNAPSGTAGAAITFASRMTLDSSGNLLVGTTFADPSGAGSNGRVVIRTANGGQAALTCFNLGAGAVNIVSLENGNGQVGRIQINGTSTSYLTSSDYRLKENVQPMLGALAKVQALNPVTYSWKVDGSSGQGFIAHELQSVVPDCVAGEKDAVETYTDEDGNEATRPVYQGIDTSFLVATLTAAIQEQQAIITVQQASIASLTTRITALEGAAA